MRYQQTGRISIFLILFSLLLGINGSSAKAGELKERLRARRPAVRQLLADGQVGENNRGYLEIRQGSPDRQLIADENRDRAQVYEIIARRQNTETELVGRRRAVQIAQKAAPGTWLQNEQGEWYRK